MPIDLYSSIKKASQWAFGSQLLNSILGSSLFVAVVIALLMILLVMIMYPAKSGTSFSVVIKMFVYMFFGSLLTIFLHDGVLKYMMEEELSTKDSDDFMRNITLVGRKSDPAYSDMYNLVQPNQSSQQSQLPVKTSQNNQLSQQGQNNPPNQLETPVVNKPVEEQVSDTIMGGGRLSGLKPIRVNTNPYS
jgi:hypothetical protein